MEYKNLNKSDETFYNFSLDLDDNYTYYDYDYDESINTLPLLELVCVTIVYGLTLILGVLGNGLVIFSIAR